MRALACLVFIALAYAIQGDPSPYGGKDAPIGKFPYQVSLRYNGKHYCGGSILNNRNILTAGICVTGHRLNNIKVHVGTNFLNASDSRTAYDVASVSVHNVYLWGDDIALVHLKTPLKYSTLVQPINLMTSDENLDGKSCTLTGWGTKNFAGERGGEVLNNLQEIELRVYPQEKCEWQFNAKNTIICTLTATKGPEDCDGDTGSPLVANGFQIGIASYYYPCAMGHPNFHARASSSISWIFANLKN
ncbi:chymotrypsin-1-like [Temnothorax longispinosus]|uniref:chymotrypsin-1-like n=1 Tax=Temnothorax longispinosus TaxID=300112 RepID=UPI003A99D817